MTKHAFWTASFQCLAKSLSLNIHIIVHYYALGILAGLLLDIQQITSLVCLRGLQTFR